jgi:hypothetical protein
VEASTQQGTSLLHRGILHFPKERKLKDRSFFAVLEKVSIHHKERTSVIRYFLARFEVIAMVKLRI